MSVALFVALLFTAALLGVTGYFLMGSVPLLILKHDTPKDSGFVRGFFDLYYRAAMPTAAATAVSYVIAGRLLFAVGAAMLALLATALRRSIIPGMDSLRQQILANETEAIAAFRRLHVTAILVNLAQVVLVAWSLISISLQMK